MHDGRGGYKATATRRLVWESAGSRLRHDKNGSDGGFSLCFGPAIMAKSLKNWTKKGLQRPKFQVPLYIGSMGMWRCHEGVRNVRHARKSVVDCSS